MHWCSIGLANLSDLRVGCPVRTTYGSCALFHGRKDADHSSKSTHHSTTDRPSQYMEMIVMRAFGGLSIGESSRAGRPVVNG